MSITSDTFTDSAGTALTAHTGEVGATWTLGFGQGGSLLISNANRVYPNRDPAAGVAWHYASGIPSSPDYDVSAVVRRLTNATGGAGVSGRMSTSANTMYEAFLYSDGNLYLGRVIAGVETLWSYALSISDNVDYAIRLKMRGDSIKVFFDDVERIAITDSGITTAGRAGIGVHGLYSDTTGFHLDSFVANGLLSTLYAAIDETPASNTDYIESSAGADSDVAEVSFGTLATPAGAVSIAVRAGSD